ncbi:fused MFS/spermidine synthase [Sphingobium phenoxybenzoativorans]|uniref:fused MFS/spermidine synthase n=1 Tax=Sphingobium phenoxybenzoativorans TaxID=1592790 RepID=UPI000871E28A|nr:fused MFS/spermidine synthase [Sphingobium phenoxybenzoativorans]
MTGTAGSLRLRFVATICAGSFLLFLVQPMIARMALPRLGGAPTVWNSAMVVYQALLLGGYAYAHWLGRLAPRRQMQAHLALFALAALMLPIGLAAGNPPPQASPVLWVPWLLAISIGPLFFMVAAQAPLMQRWYVLSGGGDPYPLYAASNLGSFAGLIAYPLLVEPLLPASGQSLLWSGGYILLLLLVAVCGLRLPRSAAAPETQSDTPAPDWRTILHWIILAAVPSGLMLSTTLHITTDIVAMPLLWVLPLGLYILSFTVAFSARRTWANGITMVAPLVLLMGACTAFSDSTSVPILVGAAVILVLFVVSIALHSALFDARPDAAHLTAFYLAMSVGGVVGGIFCAIFAPLIFDWTYEYPILLAAAALLLKGEPLFVWSRLLWEDPRRNVWLTAILLIVSLLASLIGGGILFSSPGSAAKAASFTLIIALAIASIGNRILYAACAAYLMLCLGGWEKLALSQAEGIMTRSYFGVYAIRDNKDGTRLLVHGTTVHGIQIRKPGMERTTTSYYAPQSGVGLALGAAPQLFGPAARIGVVGLGSGTLACYARPGQRWRFYEIDPAIERIARDPRSFTFLSRCMPQPDIAIGDARLVLAAEPQDQADLLAIDAFSSDSVPMHLLTREAFALYARHLKPGGLLLVHISNRYLDLKPIVAAAARDGGWATAARLYTPDRRDDRYHYSMSAWIALSRDPRSLKRLTALTGQALWIPLETRPGISAWTDDYGSILPILKL